MTTIRTLVTDGMREAGIIGKGESPDAEDATEALRRVNSMYKSLFGNELGDPLKTVNYGSSGLSNTFAKDEDFSTAIDTVYVPSNYRLVFNLGSAETLYLNPNPRDGARFGVVDNAGNLGTYNVTINGNGRNIEALGTLVLNTNSLTREWFYRADAGNWVRVSDLGLDDESPLPIEFDDLLTTLIAFRINPRYGAETDSNMVEVMKRIRRVFRSRYRQVNEKDSEPGVYRLPSTRKYWATGNSMRDFNSGNDRDFRG